MGSVSELGHCFSCESVCSAARVPRKRGEYVVQQRCRALAGDLCIVTAELYAGPCSCLP